MKQQLYIRRPENRSGGWRACCLLAGISDDSLVVKGAHSNDPRFAPFFTVEGRRLHQECEWELRYFTPINLDTEIKDLL